MDCAIRKSINLSILRETPDADYFMTLFSSSQCKKEQERRLILSMLLLPFRQHALNDKTQPSLTYLCRFRRRGGDSRHEVLQVALARDLPQQTARLPKESVRRARLEILDMVFSKDIVQLQTLRSPTISRAEEASKPENT